MTTADYLDSQMVRCGSCGSLLHIRSSVCHTCHALINKDQGSDWTNSALCRQIDPELWFPDNEGAPAKGVLDLCASCPVRRNCLRAGLHEGHGIWAGYNSQQRSELRRRVVGLKPTARDAIVKQAAEQGPRFLGQSSKP